jgi:hypothetical protein
MRVMGRIELLLCRLDSLIGLLREDRLKLLSVLGGILTSTFSDVLSDSKPVGLHVKILRSSATSHTNHDHAMTATLALFPI